MTSAPWLDGLLTALSVASAALVLQTTQAWPLLLQLADALAQAGREPDLRWLWIAWFAALLALARRAARP